jgi:hypothetical protein
MDNHGRLDTGFSAQSFGRKASGATFSSSPLGIEPTLGTSSNVDIAGLYDIFASYRLPPFQTSVQHPRAPAPSYQIGRNPQSEGLMLTCGLGLTKKPAKPMGAKKGMTNPASAIQPKM